MDGSLCVSFVAPMQVMVSQSHLNGLFGALGSFFAFFALVTGAASEALTLGSLGILLVQLPDAYQSRARRNSVEKKSSMVMATSELTNKRGKVIR
jgi:hypothetical protein